MVGIVDQGLASVTNFVLTVLVARSTTPNEFGAFALLLATYLLGVCVARGLTSETFIVRFSASPLSVWRISARHVTGATLALGLAMGVGIACVGVALGGTAGHIAVALAILAPGLLLQDNLRFVALSRGRPGFAVWNDGVMALVQFAMSTVLIVGGHGSAVFLVASWGIAAHVGAIVGAFLLRVRPRVSGTGDWFRRHWPLASRYALDDLVGQGAQQGAAYILAAVAGLSAAGALRATQTVFGPAAVISAGIMSALTPELVRMLARSPTLMHTRVQFVSGGAALVAVAFTIAALAIPTDMGSALFGQTWELARPLIALLGAAQVANSLRIGPMSGLRAMGAGNRTLRARFIVTGMSLAVTTIGAILDGARGAAAAIAVVAPIQAVIWWRQYRNALADNNEGFRA